MIATPQSLRAGAWPRAKNPTELLREVELLRLEAGALMREVFPGNLKRYALPHLPETTINKARNAYVCGAFFRSALYIFALRIAGADRSRAQRLVDYLQELVNRWWGDAPLTDEELEDESRKEQTLDTAEDLAQHDIPYDGLAAERLWLSRLREVHAHHAALIPRLATRIAAKEVECRAR